MEWATYFFCLLWHSLIGDYWQALILMGCQLCFSLVNIGIFTCQWCYWQYIGTCLILILLFRSQCNCLLFLVVTLFLLPQLIGLLSSTISRCHRWYKCRKYGLENFFIWLNLKCKTFCLSICCIHACSLKCLSFWSCWFGWTFGMELELWTFLLKCECFSALALLACGCLDGL